MIGESEENISLCTIIQSKFLGRNYFTEATLCIRFFSELIYVFTNEQSEKKKVKA